MSDLSSQLDLISASQSSKEATANALLNAGSPAMAFARRDAGCVGLTWAYYGARVDGTLSANGTVALTGSTSNYIVVHRSTLVVSVSTATTNWNDGTTYGRLYKVTTDTSGATDYEDHRFGVTHGILGGSGASASGTVTSVAMTVPTDILAVAGSPIAGSGTLAITKANQSANVVFAGPTTGSATAPTMRALVAADLPAQKCVIQVAVSDETTAITTGVAKVTFRMPHAMTVTDVRASLAVSSSSGTPTVDINEAGSTILSTKLTIDASELTSTTAATAAVISDAALADDAEITIDIDTAGTGAKGLKVSIIGTRVA